MNTKPNLIFDKEEAGMGFRERFLNDCKTFKKEKITASVWQLGLSFVVALISSIFCIISEPDFVNALGAVLFLVAVFAAPCFITSLRCMTKFSKGMKRWMSMGDFDEIYDDFFVTANWESFYDMSVFEKYQNYGQLCMMSGENMEILSINRPTGSSEMFNIDYIDYANESQGVRTRGLYIDEITYNTAISAPEIRVSEGHIAYVLPYSKN